MSRKLRKRIRELCGLEGLSKADRLARCSEILSDHTLKQTLCNRANGISFKDIERTLQDELDHSPRTKEQETYEELEREQPEKLEPQVPITAPRPTKIVLSRGPYTPQECYDLMNSDPMITWEEKPSSRPLDYTTYTPEETQALINGSYDPSTESKGQQEGSVDGLVRRRPNKTKKSKVAKA